jgi:hypothetical protein
MAMSKKEFQWQDFISQTCRELNTADYRGPRGVEAVRSVCRRFLEAFPAKETTLDYDVACVRSLCEEFLRELEGPGKT